MPSDSHRSPAVTGRGCEHVGWKPEAHHCRGTSVPGNLIISAVGTRALGSTAALSCGLGSCLLWKPCQGSLSCQWRPHGAAGLKKYFCITVVKLSFRSPARPFQSSGHRWGFYASSLSPSGPKQRSKHTTRRKQKAIICTEPVQGCLKKPLSWRPVSTPVLRVPSLPEIRVWHEEGLGGTSGARCKHH